VKRLLSLLMCASCLMAQSAPGVRFTGRVLDLEGRPLAKAVVTVLWQGSRPAGSMVTGGDGRFALSGMLRGYVTLKAEVSGRLSGGVQLLLKPDSTINLEARLPLIPWEEPKGPIPLMGLLDGEALPQDARLTRQSDGTWAWEVAAKEGSVLQAGAMVRGYTTHPGHGADEYQDGSGIAYYRSHQGRIRFMLDPRKLGRPGETPLMTILDPAQDGLRQARRKLGYIEDLFMSLAEAGTPNERQLTSLLGLLEAEAAATPGGLGTIFLMSQVAILGASGRPVPRVLAERILADLAPENYLWESSDKLVLAVLKATADPKAARARLVAADATGRFGPGNLVLGLGLN